MTWRCSKCGVTNTGSKKKCSFCGQNYPQLRYRSAAEQIAEEKAALARALASRQPCDSEPFEELPLVACAGSYL